MTPHHHPTPPTAASPHTKQAMVQTKKYPAYKDSGVEWLGEIPEHWEVEPGLKFIYENKSKNTGMKRSVVLSLSYGNIRVKQEDELTGLVPESFETYQLVEQGDLIFRPTDLQNDKTSLRSGISPFQGIITNAYLNLRFRLGANPKFYHYLFRAIDNNKVIYGLGSGLRQNIDFRDFRRFPFPSPPLPEQTAIANFLDDKTAKIDRAIAQKEKMMALLKERKQIIIQRAVTKGLNYDLCDENDGHDGRGKGLNYDLGDENDGHDGRGKGLNYDSSDENDATDEQRGKSLNYDLRDENDGHDGRGKGLNYDLRDENDGRDERGKGLNYDLCDENDATDEQRGKNQSPSNNHKKSKFRPMKHSGIEWIGEIPEEWKVAKLKYIGESLIGIIYSPDDVVNEGEGLLVLRSSNIQDGKLAFEDCVFVNKKVPKKHFVKEGDILLCARNGSAHLVGKAAYIEKENEDATFGAFMSIVRSQLGKYLFYFFNSQVFKAQTGLFSTSTINQLTADTLNNLFIAFPLNIPEQTAIVAHIEIQSAKIDRALALQEQQIAKLKELKATLIDSAVTGKIKVV